MQKLIYQNLEGAEAVFFHAPFVLCSLRGLGLSGLNAATSSGAYQQGESLLSLRREKRVVQVTLHLMAQSRREMYSLRSGLCGILSPSLAFDGQRRGRLIYQNDHGTWWTWAVPQGGLDWGKRILDIQPSVTLEFLCESPLWYGPAEAVVFSGTTGGLRLPFAMPFTLGRHEAVAELLNQGQTDAPLQVQLTGCGETVALVNLRTGAAVRMARPLPVGDVLTLCTEAARLSAVVTHPDGSRENGFGLLDPTASLLGFTLRPGTNLIRLESAEETFRTPVRMEWHSCYEGV